MPRYIKSNLLQCGSRSFNKKVNQNTSRNCKVTQVFSYQNMTTGPDINKCPVQVKLPVCFNLHGRNLVR